MTTNQSRPNKGPFTGVVCANRQLRERFYRLGLEFADAAAETFAKAQPGQFAELDLCGTATPRTEDVPEDLARAARRQILLRRPFSFCDVTGKGQKTGVDILYRVIGPATLRMTTLSRGDSVSAIGPLGNGFSVPQDKKKALLVAGGMGAGPLIHLAKLLANEHSEIETVAFAGAKTKFDLPFEKPLDEVSEGLGFALHEFAQYSMESSVATDDGSAGFAGPVTDCLTDWLGRCECAAADTIIYACGPEAMLAKVADVAEEKNIDCQVSTERMMACGIGVCQSCAVECKIEGSNETVYKLCCKDGPVFDAKEVVFST